jgi:hypothetical protein
MQSYAVSDEELDTVYGGRGVSPCSHTPCPA